MTGLHLFGHSDTKTSCVSGGCGRVAAQALPNPNPHRFTILGRRGHAGVCELLHVDYPDCTTFDGEKLLLLRGTGFSGKKLDPHLLGGKHRVIAGFEPTEEGLWLAEYAMNGYCAFLEHTKKSKKSKKTGRAGKKQVRARAVK